jgi:hypothetical protein
MIDDVNLHEWAEFNVPAELRERPAVVLSPFARRVLAPTTDPVSSAAFEADPKRRPPRLGTLLLPGLGFGAIPKP